VWFDEYALMLGDSLSKSIDDGLRHSQVGVVILSPRFFSKRWPQRELDGLTARWIAGEPNVILPVWHEVDFDAVRSFSAPLAGLVAAKSSDGVEVIAERIVRVLRKIADGETPEHALDTTAFLGAWTPKAVRLGILCGLVVSKEGRIDLADEFFDEVCATSRSWIAGEETFADHGELVAAAGAQTIVNLGHRDDFPLTLEEAHYLLSHLALQVGNKVIDLAVQSQIMTAADGGIPIAYDFFEEFMESITTHAADRIANQTDVRPVIMPYVLDQVRARLLLSPTGQIEDCELIAALIASLLEDMLIEIMNLEDSDET
jgi:hypothetical protein